MRCKLCNKLVEDDSVALRVHMRDTHGLYYVGGGKWSPEAAIKALKAPKQNPDKPKWRGAGFGHLHFCTGKPIMDEYGARGGRKEHAVMGPRRYLELRKPREASPIGGGAETKRPIVNRDDNGHHDFGPLFCGVHPVRIRISQLRRGAAGQGG